MPNSWLSALDYYAYPVDLNDFTGRDRFPNYFHLKVLGDRKSTIQFEEYFRENAEKNIAVFIEVIYWKLYSQSRIRNKTTNRIADHFINYEIDPHYLYSQVLEFSKTPSKHNLVQLRTSLGFKTDVIAIALTFPAFINPVNIPMVDNQVARWVNDNYERHNIGKKNKLTTFNMNYTSLRDNDFANYLNWVCWCKEMSYLLTKKTDVLGLFSIPTHCSRCSKLKVVDSVRPVKEGLSRTQSNMYCS